MIRRLPVLIALLKLHGLLEARVLQHNRSVPVILIAMLFRYTPLVEQREHAFAQTQDLLVLAVLFTEPLAALLGVGGDVAVEVCVLAGCGGWITASFEGAH